MEVKKNGSVFIDENGDSYIHFKNYESFQSHLESLTEDYKIQSQELADLKESYKTNSSLLVFSIMMLIGFTILLFTGGKIFAGVISSLLDIYLAFSFLTNNKDFWA